jgi:hypothetical protein
MRNFLPFETCSSRNQRMKLAELVDFKIKYIRSRRYKRVQQLLIFVEVYSKVGVCCTTV